jgi:16S rRNA (guanine966-N2)-methyltransferase
LVSSIFNKHGKRGAQGKGLAHTLRVIGGQWRGRKLVFPDVDAIRPTPGRVRETVFNWLQHDIVGASCLDLFAGSGALGIESLSRGASNVVFVDREPKIGRYLLDTLANFNLSMPQPLHGEVIVEDAMQFLTRPGRVFDIVFLDPPFATEILTTVFSRLELGRWLAPQALVYIESPASLGAPKLPNNWQLIKTKTAGQVGYHLAQRQPAA